MSNTNHNGSSDMSKQIISKGNNAVVINERDGSVIANFYTNARNGIDGADITASRWSGKTVAGAKRWAAKELAY